MSLFWKRAALAAVYAALGKASFSVAVAGVVSPVWLPAGLALGALLRDPRLWPGVLAGSLLLNFAALAPEHGALAGVAALMIACGSTIQSLIGSRAIRRWTGESFLGAPADVVRFLAATLASCLTASLCGPAALCLTGLVRWAAFPGLWGTWWLGDATGALLLAPLIEAWAVIPPASLRRRPAETTAAALLCVALAALIFSAEPESLTARLGYIPFATIVWVGFRAGQRGVASVAVATSIVAALFTLGGRGPYARFPAPDNFLLLEVYFAALSATGLCAAAAVTRYEVIQEKLRREFLANVSHELRTPLASVLGYAETLLRGGDEDVAVRREFIQAIHSNAAWLARLVEDLLDLTALEEGRPARADDVVVGAVVASVLASYVEPAARQGVALSTGAGMELSVRADPAHLRRILQNAVDNAVKFSARGGRVEVSGVSEGGRVTLSVSDRGCGIPAAELPGVFERFHRSSVATDRRIAGSGLGLTLVKQMAQANGGSVRVESELGKGTTLFVTLPEASA